MKGIFLMFCCATLVTYADPASLDKAYPDVGMSIEVSGQIVRSSEIISIPAVLSMGWVKSIFEVDSGSQNNTCGERMRAIHRLISEQLVNTLRLNLGSLMSKQETSTFQQALCDHEPDVCDAFPEHLSPTKTSRQKRFIFTAGAAFGAGIGAFGYWLYDKLAGNSATAAIEELRLQHSKISSEIKKQGDAIIEISSILDQVWSLTIRNREELVSLQKDVFCNTDSIELIIRSIPLISLIPNQFHRAVNDLLAGRVTPDLVSYDQLKEMLSRTRSLDGTLYKLDGALFYQLSHTLPVEVNLVEDFVSFLIQVPRVTVESTGILLEINNFGLKSNGIITRVKLPKYIARFRNGREEFVYVPVYREKCETSPGIWLCGQHAFDYTFNLTCLHSILQGMTHGCEWEVMQKQLDPDVMVTKSSIFYQSCTMTATVFNVTNGVRTAKVLNPDCNITRWMALTSFDLLVIGQHHVDGQRSQKMTPYILETPITVSSPTISGGARYSNFWQDIHQVNMTLDNLTGMTKDLVFDILHPTSPTLWGITGTTTVVLCIILGCCVLLALFWWRKRKQRHLRQTILAQQLEKLQELEEKMCTTPL